MDANGSVALIEADAANISSDGDLPVHVSKEDYLEQLNGEFGALLLPAIMFVSVLMVLGIVGNSVVLYVYTFKLKSGTVTRFIQALAVFDLLSCCLAMPGEIVDMRNNYTFGDNRLCKAFRTINLFCTITSGTTLVVVAIDRYKRICCPMKKQITPKMAVIIVSICACLSLLASIPNATIVGSKTVMTDIPWIQGSDCTIDDRYADTPYPLIYNGFQVLLFLVGFIILMVLYILIARRIFRHANQRLIRRRSLNAGTLKLLPSSPSDYSSQTYEVPSPSPVQNFPTHQNSSNGTKTFNDLRTRASSEKELELVKLGHGNAPTSDVKGQSEMKSMTISNSSVQENKLLSGEGLAVSEEDECAFTNDSNTHQVTDSLEMVEAESDSGICDSITPTSSPVAPIVFPREEPPRSILPIPLFLSSVKKSSSFSAFPDKVEATPHYDAYSMSRLPAAESYSKSDFVEKTRPSKEEDKMMPTKDVLEMTVENSASITGDGISRDQEPDMATMQPKDVFFALDIEHDIEPAKHAEPSNQTKKKLKSTSDLLETTSSSQGAVKTEQHQNVHRNLSNLELCNHAYLNNKMSSDFNSDQSSHSPPETPVHQLEDVTCLLPPQRNRKSSHKRSKSDQKPLRVASFSIFKSSKVEKQSSKYNKFLEHEETSENEGEVKMRKLSEPAKIVHKSSNFINVDDVFGIHFDVNPKMSRRHSLSAKNLMNMPQTTTLKRKVLFKSSSFGPLDRQEHVFTNKRHHDEDNSTGKTNTRRVPLIKRRHSLSLRGLKDLRRLSLRSDTPGTRRTTLILFLITLVYIFSFLPHLVLMSLKSVDHTLLAERGPRWTVADNILIRSYFINSVANPFIYTFFSKNFFHNFKSSFANKCIRGTDSNGF